MNEQKPHKVRHTADKSDTRLKMLPKVRIFTGDLNVSGLPLLLLPPTEKWLSAKLLDHQRILDTFTNILSLTSDL